jgi:hypothetical protein
MKSDINLNKSETLCKNSRLPDSFFCYEHAKMYHIKSKYGLITNYVKKLKSKFIDKNKIIQIQKCIYNTTDFMCGICSESQNNLYFLPCCKMKQIVCAECITNCLIEYYFRKYYKILLSDSYSFFYNVCKSNFPCPYCRKQISIKYFYSNFIRSIIENKLEIIEKNLKENENFRYDSFIIFS